MFISVTKITRVILFGIIFAAILLFYGKRDSFKNLIKLQNEEAYASTADGVKTYKTTIEKHDKWIVVMTKSPPTPDIAVLVAIPGWQLLVVGDSEAPSNWSYPGSIYLGIEEQKSLGYSITKLISHKSYTRKNIGYLFAIQHGAQFIYDTDDDNHPIKGLDGFCLQPIMSGVIYSDASRGFMNPYAHFGKPSAWPRGYPLNKVTNRNSNIYKLIDFRTPAIQQGLVNCVPDVDVILSQIKWEQIEPTFNITFDHSAPPVTLPEGVFAPFNSKNTLFHRDAFWALLLPTSVVHHVTDNLRGYWAQRLLWIIGQQLAFFPPNSVKLQNSYKNVSDFNDELSFYNRAGDLVNFLSSWTCSSKTFFQCIITLTSDLTAAIFWDQRDETLVKAWLLDLERVGYKQPNLKNNQTDEIDKQLESISLPANHSVYFFPTPESNAPSERPLDLFTYCDGNLNMSSLTNVKMSLMSRPSYFFPNLLLVVIFNFPFYNNIKFMDALYRDHFPNMVMCSQADSYEKMITAVDQSIPNWRHRQISFLNVSHFGGFYAYECIIRVIEMNYQVDGYLMVGDDILFNTWNLKSLDVNQGHYQLEQRLLFNRNLTGAPHYRFPWWTYDNGKKATEKALDEIETLSKGKSKDKVTRAMKQFVSNRQTRNLNMTMISTALSDVYYVPRNQSDMVAEVLKIFLKHKVYTDIAVASTINSFYESPATDVIFTGESLWGGDRAIVFKFFNETSHFLHPVKFSSINNDAKWKKNYCNLYIKRLLKYW